MQEFLDILNEKGEKTGKSASYDEVHQKGLIHRSVHVWFLNSKEHLLLQKRGATKKAYPNHWDISAAGHVSAGETSIEAAQKETREELGLDLPAQSFKYLFTLEEHVVLNEGAYIANEFQDVYLVKMHADAGNLILEAREVAAVRWIGIQEFQDWIKGGGGELLVPHLEEYTRLLEALEVDRS